MVRRAPRGARVESRRWPTAGRAFVAFLATVVVLVLAAGAAPAQQRQAALSDADELLFEAVAANDLARVQAVIAEGADPNARDHTGRTAADVAVDRGYFDIAHFLLAARNVAQPPPPPPPVPTVTAKPALSPPPNRPAKQQQVPTGAVLDVKKLWSGTIDVPGKPDPAKPAESSTPSAPRLATERKAAKSSSPVIAIPKSPLPPAPPLVAAREAQWPSDRPNPFDPKTLAPETEVPIVGEIRGPGSAPRVPAQPSNPDELGPAAANAPAATPSPPAPSPLAPSPPAPTTVAAKPVVRTPPNTDRPAPAQPAPASTPAPASGNGPEPEKGGFLKRLAEFLTPGDKGQTTTPPQVTEDAKDVDVAKAPERAAPTVAEPTPTVAPTPKVTPTPTVAPPTGDIATKAPQPGDPQSRTAVMQTETAKAAPRTGSLEKTVKVGPPPADPPLPAKQPGETVAPAVASDHEESDARAPSSGGFFAGLAAWVKGEPTTGSPARTDTGTDADSADKDAATDTVTPAAVRAPATPASAPDTGEPIASTEDAKVPPTTTDSAATKTTIAPPSVVATDQAEGDAPPAEAADAKEKPGIVRSLFGRLSGLLGRSDAGSPAKDAKTPTPQTASAPGQEIPAAATAPSRPVLQGVDLALGNSVRLGRRFDASTPTVGSCVTKRAYDAVFCVGAVDWPPAVAPAFDVRSSLYSGIRAVIRYDGGSASGVHAIFPTAAFAEVVDHFTARYGPPNESAKLMMAMIGEPRRPNPMVRWVAAADGNAVDVLEVRTFDDSRGTLPDLQYGVVRLFREGAASVFRHLSTGDLLVLHMKRIGQPTALDEKADLPVLAPDKPAPTQAPKSDKPTSDTGATAPTTNGAADPAKKAEAILPAPRVPVAPAAPSLVASAAPVPPPSFPVPPRKPETPSLARQGQGPKAKGSANQVSEAVKQPEMKIAEQKTVQDNPLTAPPPPQLSVLRPRTGSRPDARTDVANSQSAGATTIAEPKAAGAEPKAAGAEPKAAGAEPKAAGAEPKAAGRRAEGRG